jgi:hypothetical protein
MFLLWKRRLHRTRVQIQIRSTSFSFPLFSGQKCKPDTTFALSLHFFFTLYNIFVVLTPENVICLHQGINLCDVYFPCWEMKHIFWGEKHGAFTFLLWEMWGVSRVIIRIHSFFMYENAFSEARNVKQNAFIFLFEKRGGARVIFRNAYCFCM